MIMVTIIIIITILLLIAISLMIWDSMSEKESFTKGYWCGCFLSMATTLLIIILNTYLFISIN